MSEDKKPKKKKKAGDVFLSNSKVIFRTFVLIIIYISHLGKFIKLFFNCSRSITLLFTGNVPRGVFCEQSSQKTRELRREIMQKHDFCASRSVLL